MKRIFVWLILSVIVLSFFLTGCDGKDDFKGASNNIEANDVFGGGDAETKADSAMMGEDSAAK